VTPAAAPRTDPGNFPPAGAIGLLGGTFDPVHAGHLQLAADAQSALGLAQLRLIPAGQPWQKVHITPAHHRLAMLDLALKDQRGRSGEDWVLDPREVERAGPSYTIDTLREIRAAVGPAVPLVWIMGFDQLRGLPSWHQWQSLVGLAHIAYAQRAGQGGALSAPLAAYVEARQAAPGDLAGRPAGCMAAFSMQPVDCSATQIRDALAAGDLTVPRHYLCPGVLGYIQAHQLYLAVNGQ